MQCSAIVSLSLGFASLSSHSARSGLGVIRFLGVPLLVVPDFVRPFRASHASGSVLLSLLRWVLVRSGASWCGSDVALVSFVFRVI